MISLEEARQFFSEDELTDKELTTLVEELDRVQLQILDALTPKGGRADV